MPILKIPYSYKANVIPKRDRKSRTVTTFDTFDFEIKELDEEPSFVAAYGTIKTLYRII